MKIINLNRKEKLRLFYIFAILGMGLSIYQIISSNFYIMIINLVNFLIFFYLFISVIAHDADEELKELDAETAL